MFLFLLKRFLLALPSVWLIATLVFLLSRMLPGAFGTENILKEDGSYYSTGQEEARISAYKSFLSKTGQDLPLFYFSITSAAEPETLAAIPPGRDYDILKKLSWRYGNEAAVTDYFKSIKNLEQQLSRQQTQIPLQALYQAVEPEQIKTAVDDIQPDYGHNFKKDVFRLDKTAKALLKEQQPYKLFIPVMHWHGVQNQYHRWLSQLLKADLGNSYRDNRPVLAIIAEAIQTTFLLLISSMLITTFLAMETGIFLLKKSGRTWRKVILPFLFITDRIPVFILALFFLVFFASPDYLQLFPVYGLGYYDSTDSSWLTRFSALIPYLVLPVVCLVVVNLPYLTNQFYRAMADVSQTDYIKTAKAKGLGEGAIIRGHIFRNALLPVITLVTDFIPALVAGAVVIETIFAIPGAGSLLVQAVQARDYPVIVGIVIVVAFTKICAHLLADILYKLADPRITAEHQ